MRLLLAHNSNRQLGMHRFDAIQYHWHALEGGGRTDALRTHAPGCNRSATPAVHSRELLLIYPREPEPTAG